MASLTTIFRKLWPEKVRTQLIVGIALVHVVLMSIFVFDTVTRQRKFLKEENHEHTFSFLNGYADNSSSYLIANDYDGLERLTTSRINFPNLRYAMVLSPQGEVLAHTNIKYVGSRPSDSISRQLMKNNSHRILVETDQLLDIGTPIYADKKLIGWARVGVGQEYIQNSLSTMPLCV